MSLYSYQTSRDRQAIRYYSGTMLSYFIELRYNYLTISATWSFGKCFLSKKR